MKLGNDMRVGLAKVRSQCEMHGEMDGLRARFVVGSWREEEMIQDMLVSQGEMGKGETMYTEDVVVALAAAAAEKVQKEADRQLERKLQAVAKTKRDTMTAEFLRKAKPGL
ncbi:unnamed protein product [Prorocentrum cordatum]|uniref:Uncharacterized protein n=1 Tax=Prorocentrum cordatum TaxID=2364126 RepID=A0ABN9RX62_9DINO|nr:unnamed protein product [Polarella glacialis]